MTVAIARAVLLGTAVAGGILAPATVSAQARHGITQEWVYIRNGADSIRAYLASPVKSSLSPAIIVIHEIFGLTGWEPTVADRLAREGYIAIVPDLLSSKHGKSPASEDEGRKLIGELEPERVTADLDATYQWLNRNPRVDKGNIGTIGFCWGGGQSFRYATNNPELRAVVVAYGPPPDTADMKRIKAPVLGIYGEDDARINASLPTVTAGMAKSGATFTSEVFPGTGHGFLKPGRQGYETPERERAWKRILEFYRARLGR